MAVVYDDFSASALGLDFNGSASTNNGRLRLTSDSYWQTGSVFTDAKYDIGADTSFSTYFNFEIEGGRNGADGFAFVLQGSSPDALGKGGGELGVGGIDNSLAIVFDTYRNPFNPSDNLISVVRDGDVTRPLQQVPVGIDLNTGASRHAWIDYDGTTNQLRVYYAAANSKPATPVIDTVIDIDAVLPSTVHAGFSAATGGLSNAHDILEWDFSTGSGSGRAVRIEAEDFTGLGSSRYGVESAAAASGGQVIALPFGGADSVTTSLARFGVAPGSYTVKITYVDELDGSSSGTLRVDGRVVGSSFSFADGSFVNPGAERGTALQPGNFKTLTIAEPVTLTSSSELTIDASASSSTIRARIDHIELVPLTTMDTSPFEIVFSSSPNRSGATPLQGAELTRGDTLYAFIDGNESLIEMVEFRVDGRLVQVEARAPFDIDGTAANGTAIGLSTSGLDLGRTVVEARIDLAGSQPDVTLTSSFDLVTGSAPPPSPPGNDGGSNNDIPLPARHAGLTTLKRSEEFTDLDSAVDINRTREPGYSLYLDPPYNMNHYARPEDLQIISNGEGGTALRFRSADGVGQNMGLYGREPTKGSEPDDISGFTASLQDDGAYYIEGRLRYPFLNENVYKWTSFFFFTYEGHANPQTANRFIELDVMENDQRLMWHDQILMTAHSQRWDNGRLVQDTKYMPGGSWGMAGYEYDQIAEGYSAETIGDNWHTWGVLVRRNESNVITAEYYIDDILTHRITDSQDFRTNRGEYKYGADDTSYGYPQTARTWLDIDFPLGTLADQHLYPIFTTGVGGNGPIGDLYFDIDSIELWVA